MYELGKVTEPDLSSQTMFTVALEKLIVDQIGTNQAFRKNKAIIYNTNLNWQNNFEKMSILRRTGFVESGSYMGSNGEVTILIKQL